jgi:photosystem II stability/assembly factor-like uncharacterized protein
MKKLLFVVAAIAISLSAIYFFNLPKEESKLASKYYPSDHLSQMRSWPDNTFDIKAYKKAMQEASNDFIQLKNSSADSSSLWRLEGPKNIGGRINTVIAHPENPDIIYTGSTAGGIFKTTDGGENWFPIFDQLSYLAIGDLVFDPINPDIVYAGTGDPNIGGYPFIGNGLYRSSDAGATWEHLGLAEQSIIGKIVINPTNPNTIYVATMGIPFERSNNKGLYKTVDGGTTWEQVLFISDEAGVIDVVMNPENTNTLFAVGWDRVRSNSESIVNGQGAKVYRSYDAGANWTKLEGGLPQEDMSRLGLAVSHQDTNVVFVQYVGTDYQLENIYRTEDGGETWEAIVAANAMPNDILGGFGWYFAKIRVSPYNQNEMYVLGVDMYKTLNGGRSWFLTTPPWYTSEVHADKHDLFFADSTTVLLSTDGGLYKSEDMGSTWEDIESIPNTQFYRIAIDPSKPGFYCGGAQDNGTSYGNVALINNWADVHGGDGFQPIFDPNSNTFYCETQNGGLAYKNGIYSNNSNDFTAGIDGNDRRSWDMPIIMSKSNSKVLYTGTYRLYKISDAPTGAWEPISEDLTEGTNSRYHVITTIDESALDTNIIYVGASDGYVTRTLDGGTTWDTIDTDLPNRYVTSVFASKDNKDVVFVANSGYKDNEFIPHIHKSINNGDDWTDISGDLPQLAINDIYVIEGKNDEVIFVATDGGIYVTDNGGSTWFRAGTNMPVIPVYDIEYEASTSRLVAGTHARSLMTIVVPENNIAETLHGDGGTSSSQIQAEDKLDLKVWPTTSNDFININCNSKADLFIYNSNGQLVRKIIFSEEIQVVDISSFANGLYFVKAEGYETAKFIKQ